ncbi:UNVERIFIED_CONTAM: hypothetical protein GTU68_053288 [Idotea baltica]|nr:hypothetical protein [Idotea baltica]
MDLPKPKISISIRNLSKSYTEAGEPHAILRGANAEIIEGETVALLGRSGSGKSTLLNLISGIDLTDSGEIDIDDKCITSMNEQDRTVFRRKSIGFVYQFFNLIPTLDVSENLKLVLELNDASAQHSKNQISSLLKAVGLENRAKSFPDALSGGEQQRVAIARALVHNPSILLADEPTGNLDKETSTEIWELLDTLVRPRGGTILIATHSMEAANRCDRVIELIDGQLHDVTGKYS